MEVFAICEPIDSPSSTFGAISLEDAYEVQDMLVKNMLENDEKIIGWKVGATSRAVMDQLEIEEPFLGCMTTRSEYSFLKEIKASQFCKLAVEGEIAFVMGKTLKGPGVTRTDVIQATAGIMGAVELVDCRVTDWQVTTAEAIQAGGVAVHKGAKVFAKDEHVGKVDEFLVEGKSGRTTHLVLVQGHLWGKKDIAVPVNQIAHYKDGDVYLKVDKTQVENLPELDAKGHS